MEGDCSPLVPTPHVRSDSVNDPDQVNEHGGIASDVPCNLRGRQLNKAVWEMNYEEAAIFLQEGRDNEKFQTHPKDQNALPTYLLAHNHWFHTMDFMAALLVLALALCEKPAVSLFQLPVAAHGSLEIFGLLLLSIELWLRLRWQGLKTFIRHKRTVLKVFVLFLMFVEAIVVMVRQTNHFRVTRALRPLFLLDCHYSRGVRRIIRQILQSLPPIIDMIVLLLFIMLIFSILGFYLFSPNPKDSYFSSIEGSFISLFVLLTTANYPDVMMPAYAQSKFSALFFIAYLVIELYFLMNLLLAVVYDTFNGIEKKKLKKLFLHKRKACHYAFNLLVTKTRPNLMSIKQFVGLMKYYKPRMSRRDAYFTFKYLNTSKTGFLTVDEFCQVFEAIDVQWRQHDRGKLWSEDFHTSFRRGFKGLHWFVTWRWFEYFIYAVILINFVWILIEAIQVSVDDAKSAKDYQTTWYSIVFVVIYSVECILKILGVGPKEYFSSGWNVFDFLVTLSAIVGVFGEYFDSSFYYIMVLRPFRLLRLFKIKRRYRDVLGTLFILINRMTGLAVSMVLLYYFYGIIGMEVFAQYNMVNCCQNTTVEDFYKKNSSLEGYYYLNNFENILVSGVTLFELTVVNNWFIIMEGYAAVATGWSRIYFMLFYLVNMVVMNIVVAFILEAFIFRIQYRRDVDEEMDDHAIVRIEVEIQPEELAMCTNKAAPLTGVYIRPQMQVQVPDNVIVTVFVGERIRSKEDFSLKMYSSEVEEWIQEEENKKQQMLQEMRSMERRQELGRYFSVQLDNSHVTSEIEESQTNQRRNTFHNF